MRRGLILTFWLHLYCTQKMTQNHPSHWWESRGLAWWLGAYFKDFRGPSPGRSWVSRITPLSPKKLSDRLERKEQKSVEGGASALVAVWSPGSWDREPNPSTRSHLCTKHMGYIHPLPPSILSKICGLLGTRDGCKGYQGGVYTWKRKSLFPQVSAGSLM